MVSLYYQKQSILACENASDRKKVTMSLVIKNELWEGCSYQYKGSIPCLLSRIRHYTIPLDFIKLLVVTVVIINVAIIIIIMIIINYHHNYNCNQFACCSESKKKSCQMGWENSLIIARLEWGVQNHIGNCYFSVMLLED